MHPIISKFKIFNKITLNDNFFSEADLEDFLNNLYNHTKPGASGTTGEQTTMKTENRRRKTKRK